ncbi:hypothetical protein V1515DRAFT_214268 [Lipomyces mesembrius]
MEVMDVPWHQECNSRCYGQCKGDVRYNGLGSLHKRIHHLCGAAVYYCLFRNKHNYDRLLSTPNSAFFYVGFLLSVLPTVCQLSALLDLYRQFPHRHDFAVSGCSISTHHSYSTPQSIHASNLVYTHLADCHLDCCTRYRRLQSPCPGIWRPGNLDLPSSRVCNVVTLDSLVPGLYRQTHSSRLLCYSFYMVYSLASSTLSSVTLHFNSTVMR